MVSMIDRVRPAPASARDLESLAFELMVAGDVLAMLASARDAEDAREIAAALARLAARGELAAQSLEERRPPRGEAQLGRALARVLASLEAAARTVSRPPTAPARELALLARRGTLELARSVQSLADLWAASEVAAHGVEIGRLVADAARTRAAHGTPDAALEALDGVLAACVRAQRIVASLAQPELRPAA